MKPITVNLVYVLIITFIALCVSLASRNDPETAVEVQEEVDPSSQHVIETRNAEVYDGEVEPSLQIRQRRKAKKQKERGHETGRSSHQQRGLNNGEDEDETDNGRMGRRIHAREKTPRNKSNEQQRGRVDAVGLQSSRAKKPKTPNGRSKSKSKHKGSKHRHKTKHKTRRPKVNRGDEEREPDPVPEGAWVRLVDGSHAHEGRVEVYVDGYWGSLCDDGFDLTDASVICRQLGFSGGAAELVEDGRFSGYGHLDIVMDDIECEGNEAKVQDCEYITDHNCGKLTEVAQLVCKMDTVTGQCPEHQKPGLLMASTPSLSLGVSGQPDHPLVANLRWLLDGISPLVSTEDRVHLDIWMQDQTELSFVEITVVNVKKIWMFVNYRDNTHSYKAILPRKNHNRDRPWIVEEMLSRNSNGITVSGLAIIVDNGGGSFSLVDLKVYGCMVKDQNTNCPVNSGLPAQLREGYPNLAVAVNGNRRHSDVTQIIQLLGGAYTLDVPSHALEIAVWVTDKLPLSYYSLSMTNVDSLRIIYHFMNGGNRERIVTRPNNKSSWTMEESFTPSGAGHPTFKLSILFTARRQSSQFEIDKFQVYACSPPDGKMPTTTCYEGDGENYRGIAEYTEKGTQCMNWLLADDVNPETHPSKGLGNHNYCRNPDNDARPWCWVAPGIFGYCDIPVCGETPDRTVPPTLPVTCRSDEFTCGSLDCVPEQFVCDGEADCLDASDEDGCANVLDMFEAFPGKMLNTENVDEQTFHQVKFMFTSLKECAKRCLEMNSFICRGFDYEADEENCILYNANAGMVGLTVSINLQFYQLISQAVQCTDNSHFQCRNGRCIQKHLKCNDIDNCHDFSDEAGCATPAPLEIRLVGGTAEHEGQVQVKYMNEWGAVCDDSWDIQDAHVVCRQLGYKGAIEATVMSRFGNNQNILLDDVECNGTETSLDECSHSDWRDHNCRSFEAAGVVCRVGKVCTDEQFPCGEAAHMTCIPIGFVCDGENDCSDNSDERSCDTVEVLLVDGHSEFEGRVELIRNGIRGTVCDDSFDDNDAKVVCRMLGFDGVAMAVGGGFYGPGSGPVWLDDLECSGREAEISDCVHRGWSSHNCMHSEDAGVRCFTDDMTTPPTTSTTTTEPPSTNAPLLCGRRYMNQAVGRIIGGFEALYGSYPWQAGIRRMQNTGIFGHWCGGTILNDRWILSAAHCFEGKPKEEFRVRTGDWDNEAQDAFEQEFEVEEIYAHSLFTDTTYDHDVAVVKIRPASGQNIQFNEKVQPACLPTADLPYTNSTKCIASGWGSTGWNLLGMRVYPEHLQAAIIPVIDRPLCKRLYKSSITDRMFCAGYVEGNIDSCQGDSGGPLVCRINGANTVLGITSWGNGCAEAYAPGVYAKVNEFLPWIHQQMQK